MTGSASTSGGAAASRKAWRGPPRTASITSTPAAETSPVLSDAVNEYLRVYVDLARRLGAGWIVVHAGYHFGGDYDARRAASLTHLERAVAHAERAGARLLLENLNREPEHAEVRYLDGFLDALDLARCGEVRLADSHGRYEQHLRPGEGTVDFARMFRRLEGAGYRGHYMQAYGTLEDMLEGRERLVRTAMGARDPSLMGEDPSARAFAQVVNAGGAARAPTGASSIAHPAW